jgi:hypothetical protein
LRTLAQKTKLSNNELVPSSASSSVVCSSPIKGGNAQNQGEASAPLRGEVALNRGEASLPCLRINNSNEGSCEDNKQDIRRGVDFEAIKNRRYKDGANTALRTEWAFWRKTSKKYGFGRTELLPVRKTGEALAAYVAKYISKGFAFRQSQDKGARLVSYSKGARVCGSRFSFVGGRSHEWRLRCRLFLGHLYFRYHQSMLLQGLTPLSPFDYHDMPSLFGKRWAWRLRDRILSPMFFNPFY